MSSNSNRVEERVLGHLAREPLVTILTEGPNGDRHELRYPWTFGDQHEAGLVPPVLEHLEQKGLVFRTERIHPFDPSEYIVTWRLTDDAKSIFSSHANTVAARRG
jgi:hypothetical protein